MNLRRTTVTADGADLSTLEDEAQRRGDSLAAVMREAIGEKAARLRGGRQPHIGVAASVDGRSAAQVTAEPAAHPPA